jgi:ATP-dependent DNA helicase DinG
LTDEYERIVTLSGGRAFCLFTSRKVMNYVHGKLAARLPFTVMKQGDAPLTDLVAAFKADGSAVLFGLKSYWEGVDVAGDALSCVIISGMPFTPPSDPVFAARCKMADRRYGSRASFQKIAIPEATIAVKQAFGRGKRTETDRACIAILDGRLRLKGYGSGVIASLPPAPLTGDLDDVAAFFAVA